MAENQGLCEPIRIQRMSHFPWGWEGLGVAEPGAAGAGAALPSTPTPARAQSLSKVVLTHLLGLSSSWKRLAQWLA